MYTTKKKFKCKSPLLDDIFIILPLRVAQFVHTVSHLWSRLSHTEQADVKIYKNGGRERERGEKKFCHKETKYFEGIFLDIWTPEHDTTRLSHNIQNQLPTDTLSYSRQKDTSATLL